MATKKKPSVRKPAAKKRPAPDFTPATPPVMEPGSSHNGGLFLLVAVAALALAWLLWRSQQPKAAPAPAAVPAAANAAGTPPQARSIVTPAPAAAAAAAKPAASAHRETAGAKTKAAAPETGAPSLVFDRSSGQPLSVRCWRGEGGSAALEVFAPKNRLVRSLKSEPGKAGQVELKWDGKDEQGRQVPVGLYFLRPSQKEEQSIRDVWVKG